MRYFTTDAKRYRAECYADSQMWSSEFNRAMAILPAMEAAKHARIKVAEFRKNNPFLYLLIVPKGYDAKETARACNGVLAT